jgi:hypothetical protein
MCVVCKEWIAGKMTSKEALGNLGELMVGADSKGKAHYEEVVEKILDKEVPVVQDDELDQSWYEETHE